MAWRSSRARSSSRRSGPRQLLGVAWEAERLPTEEIGDNRLRPLAGLVDVPPIAAPLRRLAEWTADYYLSPLASVLRMVLPSSAALDGPRLLTEYRPTGLVPERLTPQARAGARPARRAPGHDPRARRPCRGQRQRASRAGQCWRARAGSGRRRPAPARPRPRFRAARAQPRASDAAASLARAIGKSFDPVLLDGVTGSGKTEVYFEAIAETLRQGRQALVLLPEIALTEPFLKRFEARFGCPPVAWHSDLRSSQRRRAWRAIASGEAKVDGRRALGLVPALSRAWPDRRRRSP